MLSGVFQPLTCVSTYMGAAGSVLLVTVEEAEWDGGSNLTLIRGTGGAWDRSPWSVFN